MEVEDRVVVLRVVGLCPHLTHRPEPERLHTVLYDDRHLAHVPSMHPRWQKINGACHSCHSWQDLRWRRITAMTTVWIITLIALAGTAVLLGLIANHDRGWHGPPPSHPPDPDLPPPMARIRGSPAHPPPQHPNY